MGMKSKSLKLVLLFEAVRLGPSATGIGSKSQLYPRRLLQQFRTGIENFPTSVFRTFQC
jgi:hypothetical protein